MQSFNTCSSINRSTTLVYCKKLLHNDIRTKQDRLALVKVMHCPWVAAVSCTQKHTQKIDLWTIWPMILTFNRLVEIVKVCVQCSCSRGYPQNKNTQKPSMTSKFNKDLEVVKVHVHAKFHQAKCSDWWVIVLTNFLALSYDGEKSKNPVMWPCDFDLWPTTLKFNRVRAVVRVHVCAKFHGAKYSRSWVSVLTEKKLSWKQHCHRYNGQ